MRHGLRERVAPILAFGGTAAALPALLLHYFGRNSAAIDGGWHFFGSLVSDLGGFPSAARRLVLDHHERLDGSGYPRGLTGDDLELDTRILAVCDVYDAFISARATANRGRTRTRLALLLRAEAGRSLDGDCVEALVRVLSWEREPEPEPARRPTSVRRGRTRPATPAAETS
jgi:HD-GYP domain-containing protein (c-di-GMP phosphodiesterase class II)